MIVLDTNAWIWAVSSPQRLPPRLRRRLAREQLAISAISCWEIAHKVLDGDLRLSRGHREWIASSLEAYDIQVLPIDDRVALRAAELSVALSDPADCLIAATTLIHSAVLATRDQRLLDSPAVPTTW